MNPAKTERDPRLELILIAWFLVVLEVPSFVARTLA